MTIPAPRGALAVPDREASRRVTTTEPSPPAPEGGLPALIAERRAKARGAPRARASTPSRRASRAGARSPTCARPREALEPGRDRRRAGARGRPAGRRGGARARSRSSTSRTASGRIQLWASGRPPRRGGDGGDLLDLDLGDIVGADGPARPHPPRRAQRGRRRGRPLLAKALRPPPDKHAGLRDPEIRYRQRYLDLMANPEAREAVRRARARRSRRCGASSTTAASSRSRRRCCSRSTAAPRRGRSSPTTTRSTATSTCASPPSCTSSACIVGGFDRVYEIGKDFRNEGVSYKHNPEFTMLETYEAYADYRRRDGDARAAGRGGRRRRRPAATHRALEGRRDRPRPALAAGRPSATRCSRRPASTCACAPTTAVAARAAMRAAGLDAPDDLTWAKLVDALLSQTVEPTLIQPTILLDYPLELSPFAKRNPDDPRLVERFEAFAGGIEIANAYTELNDPDDQRERFADGRAPTARPATTRRQPHRRGLPRRPRARHAAHRRPRPRHRPAGDAADRPALDPRGHPLPGGPVTSGWPPLGGRPSGDRPAPRPGPAGGPAHRLAPGPAAGEGQHHRADGRAREVPVPAAVPAEGGAAGPQCARPGRHGLGRPRQEGRRRLVHCRADPEHDGERSGWRSHAAGRDRRPRGARAARPRSASGGPSSRSRRSTGRTTRRCGASSASGARSARRRITGLSRRQQSLVSSAVKRARTMGLLLYPDQDRKVRAAPRGAPAVGGAGEGVGPLRRPARSPGSGTRAMIAPGGGLGAR